MILFIVIVFCVFLAVGAGRIAYDAMVAVDRFITNVSGKDGIKIDTKERK